MRSLIPFSPRTAIGRLTLSGFLLTILHCSVPFAENSLAAEPNDTLAKLAARPGIVAVLGVPDQDVKGLLETVKQSEATFYLQATDAAQVASVRRAAEQAGVLGTRLFVHQGDYRTVHLADNIADGIVVDDAVQSKVNEAELLRALRPKAAAFSGGRMIVKPVPEGIDDWSHPYHGPDNNPQSDDQYVRGDFWTQFIGTPKFSPMPEQTVMAGGRMYKAMGHIAHKANQNEMLNTLLCINAYNGTILWKRPNPPGFMIHRNTMVATDDALYMGDHESCKIIDGATGEVRDEITFPAEISDGPVWKWMAMS